MKKIYHFHLYGLLLVLTCTLFSSCIREDIQGNTPEANFESLWKSSTNNIVSWITKRKYMVWTGTKCTPDMRNEFLRR